VDATRFICWSEFIMLIIQFPEKANLETNGKSDATRMRFGFNGSDGEFCHEQHRYTASIVKLISIDLSSSEAQELNGQPQPECKL
jgi:hypothetical protein